MNAIVSYYSKHKYEMDILLSILLILTLVVHYLNLASVADTYLLILFTFLGTLPVFVSAFYSLFKGEGISMEMLASIALLFSIASGQWASAVFISLMLSSARILDEITETRTRKNIDSLLKLRPEKAKVEKDGKITVIKASDVKVGDIIVVDTGEYIPIDGTIISGDASINESSLTGESMPVEKERGKQASSGTHVVSGSIKIRTEHIGKDTTLEKIIALIEEAENEKPKTQTMGEKFSKIYLISIFFGSIILFLFTQNLLLVLSVVLVVCADDIAVAIPLAYLRAIGSAAKSGVIIKGGRHLETLGKVDTIIFDKTGTLTTGKIQISSIYTNGDISEDECARLGGIVSRRSNHPLSKAIVEYVDRKGFAEEYPDEARIIEGRGVVGSVQGAEVVLGREILMKEKEVAFDSGIGEKAKECELQGDSISFLAKDGKVVGFFAERDTVKANAALVIKRLRAVGVKNIIMLSGDNDRVAKNVASQIGITDFYANLKPEDKVNKIKELHKKHITAMVGDGVNDVAALSISHVGIAMGGLGSDSAIDSAQIVLMHDNLEDIPETIQLARSVRSISRQDFGIWVVTNSLGLIGVFSGMIGPSGAAAYNFITDFFPLFNSVRVKMK